MSAEREKALKNFNTTVSFLLNRLIALNPNDTEVERIKSRVSLAKGADRELLIREAGPYLFKYQKHITSRNEDFFLTANVEEMSQMDESARGLVDKLRQQYKVMKKAEKDQIYTKVVELLQAYLEFLEAEL